MAGSLYLGSNKVCPAIVISNPVILDMYDVNENGKVIPKEVIDGSGIKIIDKTYIGRNISYFLNYYSGNNSSIITEFNFPDLEEISDSCFYDVCYGQIKLESFDFQKLKKIGNDGLWRGFGNSKITVANFSSLEELGSEALASCFLYCSLIEDIYFNSLKTTSFGNYTDQLDDIVWKGRGDVTCTIHFPSNLESTIEQLDGYPNFGRGTQLAFDLPETE